MLLIDTSVWISIFRDRTGQGRQKLEILINGRDVFLTRFTQLELLQGSLNEKEWTLLSTYLELQDYVDWRIILGKQPRESSTICAVRD
jgi:predicted nucleic acid-binding protein